MAAIVLLISAFATWWGVGQSAITGWGAVGSTGKLLLVATVVAGFLPVPMVALPTRLAAGVAAMLSAIALGGAVVIVSQLAIQAVGFLSWGGASDVAPVAEGCCLATAGAPLAAGCCLAIAGAVTLTAHGAALCRERMRASAVVLPLIACGCVGLVMSLFFPWARYAQAGEASPPSFITLTGWQASTGVTWCLLLEALAIAVVTVIAARRSWRATVVGLAAAGWLATTMVIVIPLRAIGISRLPFGIERSLTTHESGYYIALGSALMILLLALLWAMMPSAGNDSADPTDEYSTRIG